MLVLNRKRGETLVIGEKIFLTILSVKGDQVRIGIKAPKDVGIYREEIFFKIQKEKEEPQIICNKNNR